MDDRYDVGIVGYGPVGQTLAILLGQRGWRVGVFEKQPAAYPLPRAVHFDHEVARILQAAGLGRELPRLSEPADVYEWRNAAGETLLRIGSRHAGLSGWPDANMFSQPDLERALDARARALPGVEVRRACEVVDIRPAGGDVELMVADPDGEPSQVRARWVVGCDGANSLVRRHLGATVTDLGFFFDWLIVDVVPREPRVWDPINGQLCDPARPTTVVSGGPGRRRWEFMRLPGEEIAELDSALGKVICVAAPAAAAARDAAMIAAARATGLTPPLPAPVMGPGLRLDGDPLAGHLFPQGEVRRGDAIGRFDDVVGRGFTLLSPAADPASLLPPDLAAFFASLDGVSAHVAPGGPVHDVRGSYAKWFVDHGVGVVLQRPDFHVFGTAPAVDGTAALVGRLRNALGRTA